MTVFRQESILTTQTHDRDGQDRKVSVEETVSQTESGGRVGHDEVGWVSVVC